MDIQSYLKNRVEDQLQYFNSKSAVCKRNYHRLQATAIICGVAVPVFIGFSDQWPQLKYVAAVMGAMVAIAEGWQALYKYKENWMTYRATEEALVRERNLFEQSAGVYANNSIADRTFVEQVEQILGTENRVWVTNIKASGTDNQV